MKNKIKKITAAILVALICFILPAVLFSCESESESESKSGGDDTGETVNEPNVSYTSKEIADAVMAAFLPAEIPEGTVISRRFSGADKKSAAYIEPEKFGMMITGRVLPPVEEADYLEDYAFYYPVGSNFFEVSVLKIKESEKANIKTVKNMLETRMQRRGGGLDPMFHSAQEFELVEKSEVITVAGNYAVLLVTTDNPRAKDVINTMVFGENYEPQYPIEKIYINGNPIDDYAIIYAYDSDEISRQNYEKAAETLRDMILSKTGIKIDIAGADNFKDVSELKNIILLTREGLPLESGLISIATEGDNLVFRCNIGDNPSGYAVKRFNEKYLKNGEGSFNFGENFIFTDISDDVIVLMPSGE